MARKPIKNSRSKIHSVEIEFSDENVTSFGGMILEHRLASHLGLWNQLKQRLPKRRGDYSWLDIIQSGVAGLLSGSRGSFATESAPDDQALLDLLGLHGAPEEATFWRCLEGLGEMTINGQLGEAQASWTRTLLKTLPRPDLLECEGFFPIFADASLLEGSPRREGTKTIKDKGRGLMWTTIFAGPLVAAQALANKGEGEMLPMFYGVLTNLTHEALEVSSGVEFARKVWRLYDAKGRMELGYKELLSDLGLHHPPCREHIRNAGFYSLATLAHTLGVGVKLIGGRGDDPRRREREREKRDGAPCRIRVKPRRGMRLWRLRRRLFTLPARVRRHARRMTITFLGVSAEIQSEFERWYEAVCHC